jgi:2-methylaconitate cis-trans-isomerase PrpF
VERGGTADGLAAARWRPDDAGRAERSETIPKFCIVGPAEGEGNIAVRYFTPQTGHASLAVSGGCCLAAACLIPGTVAHALARGAARGARRDGNCIGNRKPAGIPTPPSWRASPAAGDITIGSAAYRRSAQILLRGHVPLYRASAALKAWLLRQR